MFGSVVISMMKLPDAIFDMRNCDELPCNIWKTFSKYMHLCVCVAKIMFTTQYHAHFILLLTVQNLRILIISSSFNQRALFRSSLISSFFTCSPWLKLNSERDPYRAQNFCTIRIYILMVWCTTNIFSIYSSKGKII